METRLHRKVLILFAHPALQHSRVNRKLIAGLDRLEGITFHDLYENYPDFYIDVEREQELLSEHEVIVFHHPLYWYSIPAILKEWQDLVLEHGWAYGHEGRALQNKVLFNTITTGGPERAYAADGYNHYTLRQLLAPIEQTAWLCRMTYLPPFAVHGTHLMQPELIDEYRQQYQRILKAFTRGELEVEQAAGLERLNNILIGTQKGASDVR